MTGRKFSVNISFLEFLFYSRTEEFPGEKMEEIVVHLSTMDFKNVQINQIFYQTLETVIKLET